MRGKMVIFAPAQRAEVLRSMEEIPIEDALLFTMEAGLGGAWTELVEGREVIRFGYPEASASRWFRVTTAPGSRRHQAATLALERIIFARGIGRIFLTEPSWESVVRCGMKVHPATALQLVRPGAKLAQALALEERAAHE